MIIRAVSLTALVAFALPAAAQESTALKSHSRDVNAVAVSSDGKLIASGSDDNQIIVWDATGASLAKRESDQGPVKAVAFSPDGKLVAAGSSYGDVTLWDRESGKDRYSSRGHGGRVTRVAFLPGGKLFATTSVDQSVKLWDTASGTEKATLKGHKYEVTGLAVTSDKIFTCDGGGNVTAWSVAKGKELATYELGKGSAAHAVAVTADGKTLAVGLADGTVILADAASGKELRRGKLADSVNALAFAPNGKLLAAGTQDEKLFLFDPATAQVATTLSGHGRPILGVAFTPDGTRLISGSMDMTVRIWSVK